MKVEEILSQVQKMYRSKKFELDDEKEKLWHEAQQCTSKKRAVIKH